MLDERPYHHGNLRAALLQAAAEMVAESGPEAASTRAIAHRVGVAPSAMFRHFRDKRALFTAYAADGFRRLALAVAEARAEAGDAAERQIAAAGRAYLDFALRDPGLFRVMFRADQINLDDPDLVTARAMLEAALRRGARPRGHGDAPLLVHAVLQGLASLTLETDLGDELPEGVPGRVGALTDLLGRVSPVLAQGRPSEPAES